MRVLLLAVLCLSPMLAWADVIELTTGERVDGTFVRAGGDHVTITVGEQTRIFQRAQVRAIYFGTAPAPCAMPK